MFFSRASFSGSGVLSWTCGLPVTAYTEDWQLSTGAVGSKLPDSGNLEAARAASWASHVASSSNRRIKSSIELRFRSYFLRTSPHSPCLQRFLVSDAHLPCARRHALAPPA